MRFFICKLFIHVANYILVLLVSKEQHIKFKINIIKNMLKVKYYTQI